MVVNIDVVTIRKDRHLRWVREVQDYNQRRNDGLISRRVLNEFDCSEEHVRVLSMFNHLEPMASGPALLLGNDLCISTNVS